MKVQLVTNSGCVHCKQIRATLEKIKPDYKDLFVEEISTTTPEGMKLVQQHGIMVSPGVIINGKLAFTGGASEGQLRKRLNEYEN